MSSDRARLLSPGDAVDQYALTEAQSLALLRLLCDGRGEVYVQADGDTIHVCVFESPYWVERFELHPNGEPGNRAVLMPGGWSKLREQALPKQLAASPRRRGWRAAATSPRDIGGLTAALLGGVLAVLALWALGAIFALTAAVLFMGVGLLILHRAWRSEPSTNQDSSGAQNPFPPKRPQPASTEAPPNREEAA